MNTIGGYRGGSPLFETSYETWEFLFDLKALPVYNLVKVDFSHRVTPGAIADVFLFLAQMLPGLSLAKVFLYVVINARF